MQGRAARRRPDLVLITIIFPLRMPKAHAEGILNRFAPRDCCTKLCGSPFCFGEIPSLSMLCKSTVPKGKSSGKRIKFAGTAKGSPFGRAAEQSEAERARLLPLKAIFCAFMLQIGLLHKGMVAF